MAPRMQAAVYAPACVCLSVRPSADCIETAKHKYLKSKSFFIFSATYRSILSQMLAGVKLTEILRDLRSPTSMI